MHPLFLLLPAVVCAGVACAMVEVTAETIRASHDPAVDGAVYRDAILTALTLAGTAASLAPVVTWVAQVLS
jgi:hypothetical protein